MEPRCNVDQSVKMLARHPDLVKAISREKASPLIRGAGACERRPFLVAAQREEKSVRSFATARIFYIFLPDTQKAASRMEQHS
jgi:hypothetical protein